MSPLFQRLMRHATELTRAGDLRGATAAIQAALAGRDSPGGAAANDPGVIDVPAREIMAPAAALP